jgi:hypothetical protein
VLGIVETEVWNLRRVGTGRIAHPYPQRAPALDDRVAPNLGCLRDIPVAVRVVYAGAAAIEAQAVVGTLHRGAAVAEPTHRQRREAVRATVGERARCAARIAVEDKRFVEQRAREQCARL